MNLDPFSKNGLNSHGYSGKSESSADKVFVKIKYGGAGRRAAPTKALEPMEIPEAEAVPVDEKKDEPEAVLTEGAWSKPETLFQEETEVSVKVALPKGKEHMTRVEVELHVKSPQGPELISRGEAHAKADGTAVFSLPVYKPSGHQGDPADYFLVFKHKLAKLFKPESLIRKVSDIALKSADHVLVPGICFAKNSSFIRPKFASGLKALESRVKEWDTKHPKGKIVIYGHADSEENEPKALSERRAESVFAFITNDSGTWEKLYKSEKWGLIALQQLMLDLSDYKGKPDNEYGPATQSAFKAVQKRSKLPESGKEDSATRKAIFSAYMRGKHDIKLNADRFRKVAGNSWMGCAAHNKAVEGDTPSPENRRVAFVLINDSKFFPVNFPCQDGNESSCQSQCKKAGKRSKSNIKCLFYDELIRENNQEPGKDEPETTALILSEEQLKRISGASDILVAKYQPDLNREMRNKGIDSSLEKAHFLAQLCAESGSLKYSEELASGDDYEGRIDLGNTEAGDGKKFKGRGLIQITGRENYASFGTYCREDFTSGSNNKKVGEPKFSVLSAIWYWTSRDLNKYANEDNFLQVTFRVNGGFNGVRERAKFLKKGYEVFDLSDTKKRLESIIPPIKSNLDKILPLVQDLVLENPELNNLTAAKKLNKNRKITLFERLLFQAFDSDADIQSFKSELGI